MDESLERQLEQAKAFFLEKNHDKALSILNGLIEKYPDHSYCYFKRSFIFHHKKDWHQAFADLNKAISLNPDEPAYFFFKGFWKINCGHYDEGVDALTHAIINEEKIGSEYYKSTLYLMRAFANMQLGKKAEALLDLENSHDDEATHLNGKIRTKASLLQELQA